jgi:hypothetical protein
VYHVLSIEGNSNLLFGQGFGLHASEAVNSCEADLQLEEACFLRLQNTERRNGGRKLETCSIIMTSVLIDTQ